METKSNIYIADVKLNEKDKNYSKYFIIENKHGSLFVSNDLFVISFAAHQPVTAIVKNKTFLMNITL